MGWGLNFLHIFNYSQSVNDSLLSIERYTLISACAVVAGYHLKLIFVTVVRNVMKDRYTERNVKLETYLTEPQGKIKNQLG